jgi:cation diffusion facilitator family transporter
MGWWELETSGNMEALTGISPISDLVRGRRVVAVGIVVSAGLAAMNIAVGLLTRSTAVVATGVEFAGDVLASAVVLAGLVMASRPPDANHPYGHGRLETLAGFAVGLLLAIGGAGICFRSLTAVSDSHPPPGVAALVALGIAIALRAVMSAIKFRVGRRIGSAALVADAWNDAVDILAAGGAFVAVSLARFDPVRFLSADHYGGFAVGLVVIVIGLRVVRDTSLDLADTMPDPARTREIRDVVLAVPGVTGVEKARARKTGLQYHVDLHIEVDPELSVRESHVIAGHARTKLKETLSWVADVLVHVEPNGTDAGGKGADAGS